MSDNFSLGDLGNLFPEIIERGSWSRRILDWLQRESDTSRDSVLQERARQMPVLDEIASTTVGRPFAGLSCLVILHFLHDLLYFVSYLEDLGLSPAHTVLLFKPYPYQSKGFVRRCLNDWGYRTAPVAEYGPVVEDFLAGDRDILIIEDGGYLVPDLLSRDAGGQVLGAVEQTSNGQNRDEEALDEANGLGFPVLSVARSTIKSRFEPDAVAAAVWKNIQSLAGDLVLVGQDVLVVGYGSIGRALARVIRRAGCNVCVYDREVAGMAWARFDGCATANSVFSGVETRNARLVIGATGVQSIGLEDLESLPDGTYLASASSRRVEIGVDLLDEEYERTEVRPGCHRYRIADGRSIFVLAEGYPVNFYGQESIQNQVIDLVMTQLFLCAREIVCESERLEHAINDQLVNEISERERLIERFYHRHYTAVPDEDAG